MNEEVKDVLRGSPELRGKLRRSRRSRAAEPEPAEYALTDVGNAKRFVRDHRENVRYCPQWKCFLVWDEKRWLRDATAEVQSLAVRTVETIGVEASLTTNKTERQALEGWHKKSQSADRIRSLLSLVPALRELNIEPSQLDAKPRLLNCENGTLDLETFELRPHRREDLLTQKISCAYDSAAECPDWQKFLRRVLGDNEELIRFVQQAVGYSLTGEMTEQCLFLLYGGGQNGKSTFLNTLRKMLGDCGYPAAFHTFLQQQHGELRNDLAALRGKRFVTAIEAESGERLSESVVKTITGGDPVTARYLHQEYFSYDPQCKIWMGVNDKPTIRGTGRGIWRRLHTIGFEVEIPDAEVDQQLPDKLRREWPGILRWAGEGCRLWRAAKLAPPAAVQKAKAEYREEMDTLRPFIEECCEQGPDYEISSADINRMYNAFCDRNHERAWPPRTLGLNLKQRGFKQDKDRVGTRYWRGLRARQKVD